jgi:hypothetical protein
MIGQSLAHSAADARLLAVLEAVETELAAYRLEKKTGMRLLRIEEVLSMLERIQELTQENGTHVGADAKD